ncbi:NAD-P-binding protein [Lindgomyces ingoldianus]|uniref:NAD-P-binding protein n=1 Tax=Lindgomyces ingoldianus TaxID=673940 RepID=A0ACB6RIF6_9PLEO|nr:NAD-P-binding protein [Lindgomyces ingoldianus]KAF2478115.1 NAD-P-binding protein [Lindgomyces ingoldianus]
MPPIRIGFVGLSSRQSWAVWAHLPYLATTSKYTIVALCNSSVSSARAAITAHNLPPTTKAYGSPADLAADPDIDLIVCSVRVDKHYAVLQPALQAGKDVFCEWPLAKDHAEAEEMLMLAKEKGVRTLVGLQAHVSPALRKIKEIVESGRIGKVLSSSFHGTPKFFGETESEGLGYTHERRNGGNMLTIYGMHSLEAITFVLGPLATYTPLLSISKPTTDLLNSSGQTVRTIPRTSHDQILLQGTLTSSAVLSYHLRGGPAFSNTSGLIWRIYGSSGEIQITGPDTYLQISDDNLKIEVFEHAAGTTEVVEVEKDKWSGDGLFGRNIARLYEEFAEGKGVDDGVLDWGVAVERHAFVEEVYRKAGVDVK